MSGTVIADPSHKDVPATADLRHSQMLPYMVTTDFTPWYLSEWRRDALVRALNVDPAIYFSFAVPFEAAGSPVLRS
jgi:hypothetical protein